MEVRFKNLINVKMSNNWGLWGFFWSVIGVYGLGYKHFFQHSKSLCWCGSCSGSKVTAGLGIFFPSDHHGLNHFFDLLHLLLFLPWQHWQTWMLSRIFDSRNLLSTILDSSSGFHGEFYSHQMQLPHFHCHDWTIAQQQTWKGPVFWIQSNLR